MKNQVEAIIYFRLKFRLIIKVVNNVKVTSILQTLQVQKEDNIMKTNKSKILILDLILKDKYLIRKLDLKSLIYQLINLRQMRNNSKFLKILNKAQISTTIALQI